MAKAWGESRSGVGLVTLALLACSATRCRGSTPPVATVQIAAAPATETQKVTRPSLPNGPSQAELFAVLPVDDDNDLFAAPMTDLPPGVSILMENAPVGVKDGQTQTRASYFAQIAKLPAESLEQARARVVAWTAKVPLPEGERVLPGLVYEYDQEKDATEPVGWRSYVVFTRPILDVRDVRDVRAEFESLSLPGWTLRVSLSEAAAERFEAFTASHVKRRLAIVVEGRVASAPVIQTAIPGGKLTITMGAYDVEQQSREAHRLEAALLGRGELPRNSPPQ